MGPPGKAGASIGSGIGAGMALGKGIDNELFESSLLILAGDATAEVVLLK